MNVLEKNFEFFYNNNKLCKNKEFKAYFFQDDDSNELNIIYDNKNYIHYLLNIPKEKEYIIKEKIEYEIIIKDYSYDILFYKNNQNMISCILIIIINDIEFKITNENYLEFKKENFQNMNDKENIITKIKQKIINYIREQKEKNESRNIEFLLLEGENYNFMYNKNIINNENIKKLCSIVSKVEIKNNICDDNINNIFMNVYEILSPSYKSLLAQKYFEEMPNDLFDLMVKYQEVNFTKDLLNLSKNNKYIKNKNNIINIGKKENHNKKRKIIFHLENTNKIVKKKRKFKVILRKTIERKNLCKKIKTKNNIFQTHRISDNIIKPDIKKDDKKVEKIYNIQKDVNNNNIFKCINLNPKKEKKYLFSIKK